METQPPAPQADPNAFAWEGQVFEVTGTSPQGQHSAGANPQRSYAARQSAKTAALYQLEQQIRALPVHEEATVGAAMDSVISVQRGVKMALHRAEVIEEQPLSDGRYQVRVRFALAPVAEVLRQSYITPNDPLPDPPAQEDNRLGPLT